jgi:hypothetical protein
LSVSRFRQHLGCLYAWDQACIWNPYIRQVICTATRNICAEAALVACRIIPRSRPDTITRSFAMLDIAYLVIGGLFLGAFVLYALACDRL